jgi:hypothetical protein
MLILAENRGSRSKFAWFSRKMRGVHAIEASYSQGGNIFGYRRLLWVTVGYR